MTETSVAAQHADIAEAVARIVGLEVLDRINDIVYVPWPYNHGHTRWMFDPTGRADDAHYALGKLAVEHFELHKPEDSAWTATIYLADVTVDGEGETPQGAICEAIIKIGEG